MAKFILDWKCLDGSDNAAGGDSVGGIAQVVNQDAAGGLAQGKGKTIGDAAGSASAAHSNISELPRDHVNKKAPAAPSFAAVVSENARGMSTQQTSGGVVPSFAAVVRGNDSMNGSSFAAALNGNSIPAPVTNVNHNVPVRKGNFISLRANDAAYKERIAPVTNVNHNVP